MGPCLCGDVYCYSCGPAQGNHKCRYCGKWSDEGGCDDPEECDREAVLEEAAWVKQEAELKQAQYEWERKQDPARAVRNRKEKAKTRLEAMDAWLEGILRCR